jgi:hypothetical protein
VLCGEILLEIGIGFHEVSYKRFKSSGFWGKMSVVQGEMKAGPLICGF